MDDSPPTTNVIYRVLLIRSAQCGTAVIVDHDNRRYVVTANHLIEEGDTPSLHIRRGDGWLECESILVGRSKSHDLAIFATKAISNKVVFELPVTTANLVYGQRVYFFGFPYLMEGYVRFEEGIPLAFVKSATVAMPSPGPDQPIWLDGMNNPGFSGGPVVFWNAKQKMHCLCGIVSGFREEQTNVIWEDQRVALGYVTQNTGLMHVTPATAVKALIEKNPVGIHIK